MLLNDVSVIVPLGPQEKAWGGLMLDLKRLPPETEIIFVSPQSKYGEKTYSEHFQKAFDSLVDDRKRYRTEEGVRWIFSDQGRAKQLNAGASEARRPYLWFLHADTKFTESTLPKLEKRLKKSPRSVSYFNLRFHQGPRLMALNSFCVWFRSHWLRIPFGDQAFLMSKEVFGKAGEYPEGLDYGEDHQFIWNAKKNKIPVRCTHGSILTSARKYEQNGWLRTTALNVWRTTVQSYPEYYASLKAKILWATSAIVNACRWINRNSIQKLKSSSQ